VSFSGKKYVCFVFLFYLSLAFMAQLSPAIAWRKTTWVTKGLNGLPQTAEQSGEEWWYSHKNVYNSAGVHTSYVTVGYASLVSTISTFSAAQIMYNEGPDSPCNPITADIFNYNDMPNGCSDRDYMGEIRTPVRGCIGMTDLNGELIYCKPKTNGALEEVVQDPIDPEYFYVVGAHWGVRPFMDKTNFIPYNQTSASPNDNFSITNLSVAPGYSNQVSHMYVAKIHVNGTVIWQGLYGYPDYSPSPQITYESASYGYDIIKSSNGNLIAVGLTQISNNPIGEGYPFIVEIDPSTGHLIKKAVLPVNRSGVMPITNNSNIQTSGGIAHSLIEIGLSGNYAISSAYYFNDNNINDHNYALIWNIDHDFNVSADWSANPIEIVGVGPEYFNSNVWEIKYHSGLNQLLVPVVRDCISCSSAGINSGQGYIYRYTPNGVLAENGINPSPMGPINAFDLRVGVEETSDGGFVAVSSTRPPSADHSPPTVQELGYLYGCDDLGFDDWDTDALIVKYSKDGATEWRKTFDVADNRLRQTEPGDLKRQECMYKISQAQDGGYVISGNSSANFDDNYMAKVYSDCYTRLSYTSGPGYVIDITENTLWNTSQNILGKVIVHPGAVLTIAGPATSIRFADSELSGIETNLVVKEGAIVNITDGANVSSLDPSVCKNSKWDGINSAGNVVTKNKLVIYPNPAKNYFNILYNGSDLSQVSFSIHDVLGKIIKSGTINANFLNQVDTDNFMEGVYVVTLNKNNEVFEKQKLVIVKD
jgi:hypothetical protein